MSELNNPERLAQPHPEWLHTDPDTVLDTCVEEATRLSSAPLALVSLVMRHVQFFRAHRGLPLELALSCATSRSNSICQLVVQDGAPLVIEEARHHPRLSQVLVESYGIRAYVGVPVTVRGHVIGSLCVLDLVPRRFDASLMPSLERLGNQVAARLLALDVQRPLSTDPPPAERLRRLEQTTRALERALDEIAPVMERAQPAEDALAEGNLDAAWLADLRAAVDCYTDMVAVVRALSEDAAHLTGLLPDAVHLDLVAEAFALEREMADLGPLVRLCKAVLAVSLGAHKTKKAGSVVSDAFAVHSAMLAGVRRMTAALAEARAPIPRDTTGNDARPHRATRMGSSPELLRPSLPDKGSSSARDAFDRARLLLPTRSRSP